MDEQVDRMEQSAEEVVEEMERERRRQKLGLDERAVEAAMLLPLRRAMGISENDVRAPVDLNDDIVDCVLNPSCALSFQDLNRLRTSEFRVTRSWVPGWLWVLGERVPPVRALLTRKTHGDLVGKGIGGGL